MMLPASEMKLEYLIGEVDPRLSKWPMMESPNVAVSSVLAYLLFVMVLGPAWMRNRKPFEFRKTIIFYNFFLVIANAWLFNKMGKHGWYSKYSWTCEPINYSDTGEDAVGMMEALWYTFILKLIELLDTVMFILRKKTSQVTNLHVIHHAIVPIIVWFLVTRGPGGYNSLVAFINTSVHVVMYSYYALAALGPWTQKYLWWKKYLTVLQIGQFVIVFFLMLWLTIAAPCEVDPKLVATTLFVTTVFLAMFLNFYIKSYNPQRPNCSNGVALRKGVTFCTNGNGVEQKQS